MAVKKSVLAALLAAGVTGGAAGALIAGPTLVSAQDTSTTQQAPAPDGTEPAAPNPDTEAPPPGACEGQGHRGPGGPGLDAAAAALGTDADTLRQQLADGQTIAEVAEADGVDVQTVIDAMVADAKAHLDEEVANGEHTQEEADQKLADITERITAMVNGERPTPPEGEGPQGRPGRFGPRDQAPPTDGTTATPQAEGASV